MARFYDRWKWQSVWEANEVPVVSRLLAQAKRGCALDVGTGTGRYVALLRSLGHEAIGIDTSAAMLAAAAKKLGSRQGLLLADARSLPFGEASFDLAVCCRVLSHVENPAAVFSEIARVLRHGGSLIVTDVDGRHRYESMDVSVEGCRVRIKVFKRTDDELAALAEESGFRLRARSLLRACDLIAPPRPEEFPSIDWRNERPVFFVLSLTKD